MRRVGILVRHCLSGADLVFRGRPPVFMLCVIPLMAHLSVRAGQISLDTAADLEHWVFSNGPEFPGAAGDLVWNESAGAHGTGCLELRYDFSGGGNYVQASFPLPAEHHGQELRVSLNKPGGHRITFRAVDSGGQAFQKSLDYTFDGWQQVAVDLTHWASWFGGAGDGQLQPPIRRIGVLIENTASPRTGRLLIDDLALVSGNGSRTGETAATYVASDFRTGGDWRASGGGGNSLDDGDWHYGFGEGAKIVSLDTGFSLLGRPRALRLVLEADDSGHEVSMRIGSHFQSFRRSLGRLAGSGVQTLEVPLGDMNTWHHFGGQNDGQVRLPLRITRLELTRGKEGPASGRIALKRIEVDTALPDDQRVLLVPDVHRDGHDVRFSVRLQNTRPAGTTGRLVTDLRGLGERLDRQVEDVTLPPADEGAVTRSLTCPLGSHHFLEAAFQWVEPGLHSQPVTIGMSKLPEDPGSATLDPESPFGVGLYLYRWHAAGRHTRERMTELASLARRAGVKWTREEFNWSLIEPTEGNYRWDFYDDLVDVASAEGISIYGLLCYWSPYADAYTEQGVEQYCRWARAVVHRYKTRVKHWEIWNEPNIFFWSGPKELYPRLLARAYETIKEEDPEAVVLGCSTSGVDEGFIRSVMDAGGPFDVLTIHPYRGTLDDQDYIRELAAVKELVGGRPVWITEMGFPSQLLTGYSERQQAALVARVYLASLASGAIENVSWYDFRNDGVDPYYHEMNFGVVRSDFRPKPAYRALATIATTLKGKQRLAFMDMGDAAYACRFGDGLTDTIACCAPASGRVLTFETDAAVHVVNAFGELIEPVKDEGRRSVLLDAGLPVYVTSRAGFGFRPIEPIARLEAETTDAHPGQTIALRVRPAEMDVAWDLPAGWSDPADDGQGAYRLTVPADAAPGHHDMKCHVVGLDALKMPLRILVTPILLRV